MSGNHLEAFRGRDHAEEAAGQARLTKKRLPHDHHPEEPQAIAPESSMILIMGVTGSGKSYFINKLIESAVQEGHDLRACTKSCEGIQMSIGDSVVTVVDTPGFDDDEETEGETLAKITRFMTTQYQLGIALKGIVYLHRITDNRMPGSAKRYLEILQKLCGDMAFRNVALVTTMWSQVRLSVGLRREQQLRDSYWDLMVARGSYVFQFNGTSAMADTIIGQLLTRDDVILSIQRELVNGRQRLEETSAGAVLASVLDAELEKGEREIGQLRQRLGAKGQHDGPGQQLLEEKSTRYKKRLRDRNQLRLRTGEETASLIEEEKKKSKWTGRIQIFASVLGLVINVTTNIILPLVGVSIPAL